MLERSAPGFRGFGCIGRANQREERNRAKRAQLIDRLMRRTVFTKPD
jgi:hypothetical protein